MANKKGGWERLSEPSGPVVDGDSDIGVSAP